MSSNIVNMQPYLRTTWDMPDGNLIELVRELDRSYIEVANAVNYRTIGIFPQNRPAIGGEQWFLTQESTQQIRNNKLQNLRQVFTFTGPIGAYPYDIPININVLQVEYFTKCYGSILTSTGEWIGCIYGSTNNLAGQITFALIPNTSLSALNAKIRLFSAAPLPVVSKGIIVLEWIQKG